DGRATRAHLELDARVIALRVDQRSGDRRLVGVHGVARAEHLVEVAVLGLRVPVRLDRDRGRANVLQRVGPAGGASAGRGGGGGASCRGGGGGGGGRRRAPAVVATAGGGDE